MTVVVGLSVSVATGCTARLQPREHLVCVDRLHSASRYVVSAALDLSGPRAVHLGLRGRRVVDEVQQFNGEDDTVVVAEAHGRRQDLADRDPLVLHVPRLSALRPTFDALLHPVPR